jgi:N-sulfoglucosamine sulfohydrolase
VVEELYDVQHDPDCLKNLIDDPQHAADRDHLRQMLDDWMIKTADPMLDVFRKRNDAAFRESYVQAQEREADARRAADGKKARKVKGKGKGKRKATQPAEAGC